MALQAGVMGAAGFAGVELVRLLAAHPAFDVKVITSDAEAGSALSDTYPAFYGVDVPPFTKHDDPALLDCDVVFLAVPHTAAMKYAPRLLQAGVTVIDLSADYRLADPQVYEQWYATPHTSPELLETRAFGLPELFRDDMARAAADHAAGKAVLVGCAGCYPTATSLAAAPAVRAGLTDGLVVVDAISGVTGAGKKATPRTHFCFANENLEAYGVGSHRHTPEIEQILGKPGEVLFTPHLAPLGRGLLSTVTLRVAPGADVTAEGLQKLYEDFYRDSALVTVLPAGIQPKTSSVVGTARAHVGVVYAERVGAIVATGAIDNLCKGAAGQALQCANIVCGFNETCGLPGIGQPV
ncbi:MAG: N-acetyl-gamma-glutamyl-phosphate reductase [Eggerthellaceae bacterium]